MSYKIIVDGDTLEIRPLCPKCKEGFGKSQNSYQNGPSIKSYESCAKQECDGSWVDRSENGRLVSTTGDIPYSTDGYGNYSTNDGPSFVDPLGETINKHLAQMGIK